ncbi:EAL domain-containing protein [Mycobacterium sp. 236(2023)]|uniref:putative bifunctional diguanylate cyclase/phosphodiesterase n=1 Tax=Mycobacterium sp. 236(2023) TaxID=3038163 RepID=UPI0024158983|nr:EAL domain-containing protein [Mycobacterium sp. 236(2023)]MDG4664510.1 EAL domain-containing protein [Mycobacterium sp. 236(2023)]
MNALALWGKDVAHRGEIALQLMTGLGAVICGLVVAARMTGLERRWRLLMVAGMTGFLLGQILWWAGDGEPTPVGVVAYVTAPLLAFAAVLTLLRASGGVGTPSGGRPRYTFVTTLIDGIVAGCSFFILVAMGEFGVGEELESLPRTSIPIISAGYAVTELIVIVAVVVLAMIYNPERPDRANYLLLAGGCVAVASSERIAAYFASVNVDAALWAGIGYVIGPLLIAFAMLDLSRPQAETTAETTGMDWAQLLLPYVGFLGTAVLFAFHVLIGEALSPAVIWVTVVMVLLVAVRQVVAMRAQYLLTQRLITAQRGLAHQVLHDSLTGLPNRLAFARRLDAAMVNRRFVLIFVDLDDFKDVNDRFGHAAGDELLCAVGERLARCLNGSDTLARIGGDEFAILVDDAVEEPEVVAHRLRVALRAPFSVHGSSVRVRASMGLVRPDLDPAQTSDDLLRQADVSMYAGKRLGKNTAVVYQPQSGVHVDFPTALRNAGTGSLAGFSLVYQPIVELPKGQLAAVEVLSRWTAPNGLQISPETFVAVAEAAGLGAKLDALVLEMACAEVAKAGLELDIHVNVGAARLGNPSFEENVRRALDTYAIPPERVVMEITETVPIVDLDDAAAQIARFSAFGVQFALDDFGAGFNSLTYLHALPVQFVKLDRSLLLGTDEGRDFAIYRSVVGVCSELGMSVIAEGLETPTQAQSVFAAGCHLGQGHMFGRPMSIDDVRLAMLVGDELITGPR